MIGSGSSAPEHSPGSPAPSLTTSPSRRRHPGWQVILAVAVGGWVGSLLHLAATRGLLTLVGSLAEGLDRPAADTAVLAAVNLVGSFLLGVLTGSTSRQNRPTWLTTGLGVGLLGSFTTLSGVLVVWTVILPRAGLLDAAGLLLLVGAAVLALAAQAVVGTLAAVAGLRLGGWRSAEVRS